MQAVNWKLVRENKNLGELFDKMVEENKEEK